MPTSILRRRRLAALALVIAAGCTTLSPLDERAPLDGGGDASMDPGTDAGVDGGLDAGSDAGTGTDAAVDAGVDASSNGCVVPGSCSCAPTLTSLDLRVVAHGARLTLSGACFTDANAVRIGGVEQAFTVADDGRITVDAVDDATPLGTAQSVVVTSPVGTSAAATRPVVHLVVDELDSVTDVGSQRRQFVEIATGIDAALDLGDYMLVLVDGGDDGVHSMPAGVVLGTTGANGRYLIGGSMVAGVHATLVVDALTGITEARAAVLYQGSTLPDSAATISQVTGPMIDALVYAGTSLPADSGLLAACYPSVADRVQVAEDANAAALTESIRRCGTSRRAGTAFSVASPTPGNPNGCP